MSYTSQSSIRTYSYIPGTVRRSAGAHQRRALPLDNEEYGLVNGLPPRESIPVRCVVSPVGSYRVVVGAKRNLEARQLGAVTDTVAGLLPPLVDKILDLLGLQRTSTISTAEALPEGVAKQLEALVGQVTGGLPVVGGVVSGAAGSAGGLVGAVTGREDSGTSAPPPSPSSPAPGPPAPPAPPSLPVSGLPVALPTGVLPLPLPVQPPSTPVTSALPVLFGPPSNATA